jgi:hypothetical protein
MNPMAILMMGSGVTLLIVFSSFCDVARASTLAANFRERPCDRRAAEPAMNSRHRINDLPLLSQ